MIICDLNKLYVTYSKNLTSFYQAQFYKRFYKGLLFCYSILYNVVLYNNTIVQHDNIMKLQKNLFYINFFYINFYPIVVDVMLHPSKYHLLLLEF